MKYKKCREVFLILSSSFLLFLQALRESTGGVFDSFFMSCTDFGNIHIILFLIGVLYWTYDKKLGEFLLVSLVFSRIANSFTKLSTCVYRPWVVDSNIKPYEAALESSTGYSLPSGHATSSGVLFLGSFLRGNLSKGLKILSILFLAIICFSRCYLGVHTLLDVVVGLVIVVIVLFVVGKVFDRYGDNPNFDLFIAGAGILLSVLLLIYTTSKSYPMDYDAAGKLIVNPAKMALEAFKDVGFCTGVLISWVIERRFVKFSCEGSFESKILRIAGAYIGYLVIMNVLYPLVKSSFEPQFANFLAFFMFPFYVVLVVPVVIKFFQNRKNDVK